MPEPNPAARSPHSPDEPIVPGRRVLTALPVFNEARHVRDVLPEVLRYSDEVLVVNDGSTDGTLAALEEIDGITVISHPVNFGYGAGLKTAFHTAIRGGYDALVTIDCDGQHQPRLIPELAAACVGAGQAVDVVSGSRYHPEASDESTPPPDRRAINFEITERLNELFDLGLTDAFCGFKAYSRRGLEALKHITEYGYAQPLQTWVHAVDAGLEIVESPVPLVYLEEERSFGGSLDDAARRRAYYHHVLTREMADRGMITIDWANQSPAQRSA